MSFFTHLGLVKKWYIVDKSKKGNFKIGNIKAIFKYVQIGNSYLVF